MFLYIGSSNAKQDKKDNNNLAIGAAWMLHISEVGQALLRDRLQCSGEREQSNKLTRLRPISFRTHLWFCFCRRTLHKPFAFLQLSLSRAFTLLLSCSQQNPLTSGDSGSWIKCGLCWTLTELCAVICTTMRRCCCLLLLVGLLLPVRGLPFLTFEFVPADANRSL